MTATVTRDGDQYVAQCVEVDVASQGDTVEEALAMLKEALELHLEDDPPQLPQPTLIARISVSHPG